METFNQMHTLQLTLFYKVSFKSSQKFAFLLSVERTPHWVTRISDRDKAWRNFFNIMKNLQCRFYTV